MSDEDYSSEEERRLNRSQRLRRDHNISSDKYEDREGEDAIAPSSPAHYRSDENEGHKEDPAEKVSAKDVAGPQLTKEAIKEAMKGNKRVDEITTNMVLNQTILDHYHNVRLVDQDQGSHLIILHQVLLGGGAWTK